MGPVWLSIDFLNHCKAMKLPRFGHIWTGQTWISWTIARQSLDIEQLLNRLEMNSFNIARRSLHSETFDTNELNYCKAVKVTGYHDPLNAWHCWTVMITAVIHVLDWSRQGLLMFTSDQIADACLCQATNALDHLGPVAVIRKGICLVETGKAFDNVPYVAWLPWSGCEWDFLQSGSKPNSQCGRHAYVVCQVCVGSQLQ